MKTIYWLLGLGTLLLVVGFAIIGLRKKQTDKPEAGSPEQMAAARDAKEEKRILKKLVSDENEITQPENL
jgi:uncharacterized membrane protein